MVNITVIILTFNEEENLPAALDSVKGWANEVFVVDSYSTDSTVDIALSQVADGVQVVQHRFENYSAQWNWALTHLPIKSSWTLKLDADERVTPAFKVEVMNCLKNATNDLEGIYFRRRMIFMGTLLRWGGMSSNYVLHLWKTGKAIFEDRQVNEHALVGGKIIKIQSFVDHHDYKSVSEWLEKHNRYSSMETASIKTGNVIGDVSSSLWGNADERRMWFKKMYFKIPARPFFYFLSRYVFRLGFLDGKAGFRFAFLHAAYFYWIDLKIIEYQTTGKKPEIIWPVRGQPHPVVVASSLQKLVDDQ